MKKAEEVDAATKADDDRGAKERATTTAGAGRRAEAAAKADGNDGDSDEDPLYDLD